MFFVALSIADLRIPGVHPQKPYYHGIFSPL